MKQDKQRKRGQKPPPCTICGRTFDRKDTLQRHSKTHLEYEDKSQFHRIVKGRFRACSECQSARTRCSGTSPCARCKSRGKECLFNSQSPVRTSSIMSSSPTVSSPQLHTVTQSPRSHSMHSPDMDHEPAPAISNTTTSAMLQSDTNDTTADQRQETDASNAEFQQPSNNHLHPLPSLEVEFADFAVPPARESPLPALDPFAYKPASISDFDGNAYSRVSNSHFTLRYPVLETLEPFLDPKFSLELVCNLLEAYFSSRFKSRLHPACHYIHAFIVRRSDILDTEKPRQTHPALLASMLWVAALSDSALGLFAGSRDKEQACAYLSLLSFRLLDPAVHGDQLLPQDMGLPSVTNLPRSWPSIEVWQILRSKGFGPMLPYNWAVDYIMAFIHLGSVISASEKKADSIKWWRTAFTLAKDTMLYEEIQSEDSSMNISALQCGCSRNFDHDDTLPTEVQREERRRTWWLLFLMDRHLALCYNRPLALSEVQCQQLLLPMDEIAWQTGVQPHSHGMNPMGARCYSTSSTIPRNQGPPLECSGESLFEFFLPLMTITGHLLELNRAKNHPLLGMTNNFGNTICDRQIQRELDVYQDSLNRINHEMSNRGLQEPIVRSEAATTESGTYEMTARTPPHTPSNYLSPGTYSSQGGWYSKIALLYAKHVLFVLRILLSNKWDPACLFEDADFWTSSHSFRDSMSHTITATETISEILQEDPDISFMPYFFGIQLLHGSLLLLLVTYRLQVDSGPSILKACETVITATEACYVTLPTDYQRQFRNLMRSALKLAKGWKYDSSETEKQLSAVLARYRWSRNGGGLAKE